MRKVLFFAAVLTLVTTQAFAAYMVVLKDGTQYKAKTKWTMKNGKAIVELMNGQTLALNPSDIDVAKSDQLTKMGLGSVGVIEIGQEQQAVAQKPSLGSALVLKPRAQQQAATAATTAKPGAAVAPAGPLLASEVLSNFERAYENVGVFEHKLVATGATSMRAELTADLEDKVFNALSATSFLMVRNAGIDGAKIDLVELFIKTTTGGSAGRFQMTKEDAEMLDKKAMTLQEYFVRKVIF